MGFFKNLFGKKVKKETVKEPPKIPVEESKDLNDYIGLDEGADEAYSEVMEEKKI